MVRNHLSATRSSEIKESGVGTQIRYRLVCEAGWTWEHQKFCDQSDFKLKRVGAMAKKEN